MLNAKELQTASQTHDGFFKKAFSYPAVMRDFLKSRLDAETLAKIDLSTVRLENTNFVTDHLKQYYADLIFSAEIKGQEGYIYVALEQQTNPDVMMPARVMMATALLMIENAKKQRANKVKPKDVRMPPIINLVLYTGSKSYGLPTRLVDAFTDKQQVYKWLEREFVLKLRDESDGQLKEEGGAAVAELLLKHAHEQDFLGYIAKHPELTEELKNSPYKTEGFAYMYFHDKRAQALLEEFRTLAPEITEPIMNTAQLIRKEGKQEGITIGKQEGITIGKQVGKQEGITIGKQEGWVAAHEAIKAKLKKAGVSLDVLTLID